MQVTFGYLYKAPILWSNFPVATCNSTVKQIAILAFIKCTHRLGIDPAHGLSVYLCYPLVWAKQGYYTVAAWLCTYKYSLYRLTLICALYCYTNIKFAHAFGVDLD